MQTGTKIVLSILLFVVGAAGMGVLKELYGYGQHRAIWSVAIVAAIIWIWIRQHGRPTESGPSPAASEQVSQTSIRSRDNAQRTHKGVLSAPPGSAGILIVAGVIWFTSDGTIRTPITEPATEVLLRCEPHKECLYCGDTSIDLSLQQSSSTRPRMRILGEDRWTFEILTTSASQYYGRDIESGMHTLDLDRVNGNLSRRTWGSPEEMAILIDMCAGRITGDQCAERTNALRKGANIGFLNCLVWGNRPAQCSDWQKGSKVLSESLYTCRAVTSKF